MTVRAGLWANTPTNIGVQAEADLANFGAVARTFPAGVPCYSEDTQTLYIWDPQDTTSPSVVGQTVAVLSNGVQIGTWHAIGGGTVLTAAIDTVVGATDSLKSIIPPINGITATVKGYYTPGDGGGSLFYWDATNIATDDGGVVIRPTMAIVGAWIRIFQVADIRYWGYRVSSSNITAILLPIAQANDIALIAMKTWAATQKGAICTFPGGIGWITTTVLWTNTYGLKLIGVPAKEGDSTTFAPEGTYLRTLSTFTPGAGVVDLSGSAAFDIQGINVCGKDESVLPVLLAGRGFTIGSEDGGHIVLGGKMSQCHALQILNPSILRGLSKTSNLVITPPAITTTGLSAPTAYIAILVDITTNGTVANGLGRFRVSVDGGRTYAATNQTIVADYVIPTTTIHLLFSGGAFTTDYEYYSEAYGFFVGSVTGVAVQNLVFDTCTDKDTGQSCWHEGSQSVSNTFRDCSFKGITRAVVNHSGNARWIDCEISNDTRGAICRQIRAGALLTQFIDIYSEVFGGTAIQFPTSVNRVESTDFFGDRVLFHEGAVPSGLIIDYKQLGPITTVGCEWLCSDPGGGDIGTVSWVSPNANIPVIHETGARYGGGVTKVVTGVYYHGTAEGVAAEGGFNDRIWKTFGAYSFGPFAFSDNPAFAANMPICGLFHESTTDDLVITNLSKHKVVRILGANDDVTFLANTTAVTSTTTSKFIGPEIDLGTNPATAGLIRVPHNSAVIEGLASGGGSNIRLLQFGVGTNNLIVFGDNTNNLPFIELELGGGIGYLAASAGAVAPFRWSSGGANGFIGFYNKNPIDQKQVTNNTTGAATTQLVDVTTTGVADPAKINNNFATIVAALQAVGLWKN